MINNFINLKHKKSNSNIQKQINIDEKHKKSNNNIKKQINIDGKRTLENNEIINRLEIYGENNNFIPPKDHKENFNNNPRLRLINPAKK